MEKAPFSISGQDQLSGWFRIALVLALVSIAVFSPYGWSHGRAATFQVTKIADTNDGDCSITDCSLREAIVAANSASGEDTVILPAGVYGLSIAGKEEDESATGDLDIRDNLTLQGAGESLTIIDANRIDRVLQIADPQIVVNISDLTIQNGDPPTLDTLGGGGILNQGVLDLVNVTLKDNRADRGGGLRNSIGTASLSGCTLDNNIALSDNGGGGIYNNGELTVSDSLIQNNSAPRGAGVANTEDVLFNRVTLLDNAGIEGGGIYNDKNFTLYDVTLSGNTATSGGGLYNRYHVQMERVTLDHNSANLDGGGMYSNGPTSLTNVTLSANSAFERGGGIYNNDMLTLLNTTVYSNTASRGGGIFNELDGIADLKYTIIAKNLGDLGGDNCWDGSYYHDQLNSQGFNIDDRQECELGTTGDLIATDPLLGPLQNNGGWTKTHEPDLDISPALDIGTGDCAELDQRLVLRPVDSSWSGTSSCESGAVEVVTSGYLAFSPRDYTVNEEDGTVTISVARPEGTEPVGVSYAVLGGTARAGIDYILSSGELSWENGQTTPMTFEVTLLDDNFIEDAETIDLVLSHPTGGAGIVWPNHLATITINASDPEGIVEEDIFLPLVQR